MPNKIIPIDFLLKVGQTLKQTSPEIYRALSNEQNPITRSKFYGILGFPEIPKISPYRKDKMVIHGSALGEGGMSYTLRIDGNQWMTFNSNNFTQLFQFYSHHHLATGHCICTGLGFGLREKWLLSKKEVSKLTVLEKNVEVINYHKEVNPELMNQLEIIHSDASEYTGKCDTLLLDHYEYECFSNPEYYFSNIKQCCNNISHNVLWFWPLERMVTDNLNKEDESFSKTRYTEYLTLTKNYPTLPNITESELNTYCDIFYLMW